MPSWPAAGRRAGLIWRRAQSAGPGVLQCHGIEKFQITCFQAFRFLVSQPECQLTIGLAGTCGVATRADQARKVACLTRRNAESGRGPRSRLLKFNIPPC